MGFGKGTEGEAAKVCENAEGDAFWLISYMPLMADASAILPAFGKTRGK